MRTPVFSRCHVSGKNVSKNRHWVIWILFFTILNLISRHFVLVGNFQNSFPAGSFPRKTGYFSSVLSPQRFLFPLNFTFAQPNYILWTDNVVITEATNVDTILFFLASDVIMQNRKKKPPHGGAELLPPYPLIAFGQEINAAAWRAEYKTGVEAVKDRCIYED